MLGDNALDVACEIEGVSASQDVKSSIHVIRGGKDLGKSEAGAFGNVVDWGARASGQRGARIPGASEVGTDAFAAYSKSLDNRSLGYRFVKRTFDIMLSLVALALAIVFFPITAALLIATSVSTGGSPFYTQERIGQYGRKFRVFKLRTMVADSDNVEKYFSAEQLEQWKRERKVDNDPRITPFCRVLRATSLDELPQFANVLFAQMTAIGPRCISESEVEHFGQDAALLLSVPQGITGAWQIGDRNKATFENGTRQAIELEYCRQASLLTDVKIFFATFAVMLVHRTGK